MNNENAEQENEVAIVEEVVVTNDKVERVDGTDVRVLQHVKVGMQGCNDVAAARDMQMQTSSSGIESSTGEVEWSGVMWEIEQQTLHSRKSILPL